jgi:ABC-type nickel/cobalt efflux system permease component RcnA
MKRILLITLIAFFTFNCSNNKDKETLAKASAIHNEAYALLEKLEDDLKTLKADTTINQDSVAVLSQALSAWEENLVEVPGNEHEHHHHEGEGGHNHDHDHNHAKAPDVTTNDMLAIQTTLKNEIEAIAKRFEALKK